MLPSRRAAPRLPRHRGRTTLPARAAAPREPPPSSVADSLAALDKLCGVPEAADAPPPVECPAPPAEADAGPTVVPMRRVELTLEDLDTGEERPLVLELPVATQASRLVVCALPLPLGVVFEERDRRVVVVEITADGSAAALPPSAPRPRPGDVLRAVSACIITMEYSGLNLLGGGNGRPRTRRVAYRVDDEATFGDQSFAQALAAVKSNARAGRGDDVTLVLERGP